MLFLHLVFLKCKTFSFLVQTSKGFNNYRHMTDMFIMYINLLKFNSSASNIFTYFPEDIYKDKRNIQPEFVQIDDVKERYIELSSKGYSVNDVLNGLRCNIPELKDLKKSDNIFIYIVGHGCDGCLKFHDKEWLTKDDLMRTLRILSKRVNKILLIIDTCEAESIISRDIENMYILTTSTYGEPSLSLSKNKTLGISTVDEFPFYFDEVLKTKETKDMSLNHLFSEINTFDITSTITWTNDETFKFSEFFNSSQ